MNDGGDGWCPITSDAGLVPIEQLTMQIESNGTQVNPTMSLTYEEFIRLALSCPRRAQRVLFRLV
jgi:hypothetical protein